MKSVSKNLLRYSILIGVTSFSNLTWAKPTCHYVLTGQSRLEAIQPTVGPAIQKFWYIMSEVSPEVLAAKSSPTWHDFQKLEQALQLIVDTKKQFAATPDVLKEFELAAGEIRQQLVRKKFVKNLKSQYANASYLESNQHKPTEYEMKLAMQQMLGRINRELPSPLRLPIARLRLDSRRAEINEGARKLISEYAIPSFEKAFPTTGHKNFEQFEAKIRASTDPLVQRAIKLIDEDQLEIIMRRPVSARFWVPKTGFHNQFVTGSSKGTFMPDYRNVAENNLYGTNSIELYKAVDPEIKPKYGTIRAKAEANLTFNLANSDQYGPDLYTFKTNKIEDRLTVFTTDSLSPGIREKGGWTSKFIPWKYRLFMVPFMLGELQTNTFGTGTFQKSGYNKGAAMWETYWESQIAGSLRLNDVDSFTFMTEAPEGEFLRELQQHEIKIFDGRNKKLIPWVEPTE